MAASSSSFHLNTRATRPLFLASVTSVDEAELCLKGGVGIIDCKDPATGALGALPARVVEAICRQVDGRVPVSATIGEQHEGPEAVVSAAMAMAATGVPIIKIGFVDQKRAAAEISAITSARQSCSVMSSAKFVGVLFADQDPDFELLRQMKSAGFSGVMLDTADKLRGALTDVVSHDELGVFIATAQNLGLFAGLAGSLRAAHIAPLLALNPDILGFRGGICAKHQRRSGLDEQALAAVRRAIPSMDPVSGNETSAANDDVAA